MADGEKPKIEAPDKDLEAGAIEDFARLPSTLPPIGVDLRGFPTEEQAKSVGEAINSWLYAFGKILNLKGLKQVIVAYDYDGALAGIDRGAAVSRPLTATNDGVAVGIAMTPTVLVEGEPKSVMVLNAAYMAIFALDDKPEHGAVRDQMIYTLAHECGHVHDLDVRASCLPEIILKKQLSFRDGILFAIASGCWDEYIACRLSAFIGKEAALRPLEDTFCTALERAKGRADAAIRQYRMHADVSRMTNEVAEEYKRVMVYASYMLGHIDGMEGAVGDLVPKALDVMERHPYFKPFFSKLHEDLRAMHTTYGEWKDLDVYEPLRQLADEFLRLGGIEIQERPDGAAYVNVPFSPETTPTMEEQTVFLSAKSANGQK